MDLVIVESPAKAKTINGYLGSGYTVLASFGHVRDLPPKDGSVDPDDDFAMAWEVSADRAKQLRAIVDAAKTAGRVILATDPDREGEAISWHLAEVLRAKKAVPKAGLSRVTFNAVTKSAVTAAMAAPRQIDQPLVDAYLARRALDYLVGFTLSPVLWRKLPGAKSAGRVQSVALRIIVDREREIEAFRAREYWGLEADLTTPAEQPFTARLVEWRGGKVEQFTIVDGDTAEAARADIAGAAYGVAAVETKPFTRNPSPPFTTSTLQQEAARKLGFSAQHTMRVAQGLYEAGLITYMRTDGVDIGPESVAEIRAALGKRFTPAHVPVRPRVYTAKAKNAQEAHEAIRPTDPSVARAGDGDAAKLYDLIWKRTLASQAASAQLERTTATLAADDGRTVLRATGQVVIFPGFLSVYEESRDEKADADDDDSRRLPKLAVGDRPALVAARAIQRFTQPPPRFSEASLVKRLEELGIGRPSTYASILQTLKDRSYVTVDKNRFTPEEKGRLVTAFLERFFERYVAYDFTAGLETQLDEISAGDLDWKAVLREFWRDFQPMTAEVMESRPSEVTVALDQFLEPYLFPDKEDGSDARACPACENGRLALRGGKFGAFVACSNYPECRYTRPFASEGGADASTGPRLLGEDPETGEPIEIKSGRFGRFIQRGPDVRDDEAKPHRASLPDDIAADAMDLAMALKLLALPREVGAHPETGELITAAIGRYGPYLKHAGKYARLSSTADVFETGMNMAVALLAQPRGVGRGAPREPLRVLGPHPGSGADVRLMEGKYGVYVTDGTTNATLPKGQDPSALALDDAVILLAERALAAPAKGKRKVAAKKAPAKAAPAKKAVAGKKPPAKKAAPKRVRAAASAE